MFNQHQLQTFMHCGKVRGNRIQLAVLLEIEASLCAAAVYMAGGMVRQVLLIVFSFLTDCPVHSLRRIVFMGLPAVAARLHLWHTFPSEFQYFSKC